MHHEFKQKKEEHRDSTKTSILAKYGGAEYLDAAPKELRQGQTENYVEYSRTGQVIKGKERAKARSKYPEDGTSHSLLYSPLFAVLTGSLVYINNHTAVWGSWYDKSVGEWGYRCCHSTLHISYCAGLAGIEATEASSARQLLGAPTDEGPSSVKANLEKEKQAAKIEQNFSKQRVGEGDVALDKEKLERALKEEKKRKKNGYEDDDRYSKKSKGTVESSTHDVTEEQLGEHILFAFFCSQRN